MDEDKIVSGLMANVPAAYESPAIVEPGVLRGEQSSTVQSGVSEYSLLKLGISLGVDPTQMDADTSAKLKHIYEDALAKGSQNDLESVLTHIKDTLVNQGLLFREDRFMRLWLYLRLNKERNLLDQEIERTVHGG